MAALVPQQDEFSDYGSDFSDFTPDEEQKLKSLLQQAPLQPDNPITDPDLQIKDLEDETTPRGVKVRTLGYEPQTVSTPTKEKKRVTIQIDGRDDNPTNGMLHGHTPDNAD